MRCLKFFLAAAISVGSVAGVAAQGYPQKTIKLVVPFPPGGGTDAVARILLPKLSEALGKPIIIENVAGAAGNVGSAAVAKAEPDGHTLLFTNNSIVINAGLPNKPQFDILKDFSPVAMPVVTAVALGVNPSMNIGSVHDFLALARAEPKKLTYSSCGVGTAMHLAGELMKQLAHIDMLHVPYRGCGPALIDALSSVVPVTFNSISNVMPQYKAEKIRVLALGSSTRSPLLPEIPTIQEAGVTGFESEVWIGMLAPAGTPAEIVKRLNVEINRVTALPEVKENYQKQFYDIRNQSPAEFSAHIKAEFTRWSRVIKEANIQNQ
jgi:tripartite-type tricarboxylate transporter receptor subunit TctC